ncbi:hypothetical protein GCM10017784_23680 [Deinococcus indicus]|nr:hypothetical protein GCM10017784_23680 [Deinococcus indicus]
MSGAPGRIYSPLAWGISADLLAGDVRRVPPAPPSQSRGGLPVGAFRGYSSRSLLPQYRAGGGGGASARGRMATGAGQAA